MGNKLISRYLVDFGVISDSNTVGSPSPIFYKNSLRFNELYLRLAETVDLRFRMSEDKV